MKKTIFALALGATTLVAGAATAGGHYWYKHGKVCFHNKWGHMQCVRKNHYKHKPVIVVKPRVVVKPKYFYSY